MQLCPRRRFTEVPWIKHVPTKQSALQGLSLLLYSRWFIGNVFNQLSLKNSLALFGCVGAVEIGR